MPIAYCTECDWRRTDEEVTDALDRAMIDHYVETGHSPIERADGDLETCFEALGDGVDGRSGTVRVDRGSDAEFTSDSASESE